MAHDSSTLDDHDPHVSADESTLELTVKAVVIGLALNVVMLTANTYLGLRSGLTISASIPAAVISMGIFYGLDQLGISGTILENNIVQTMTSAGEALAAGVIFTIAGVVFLGEAIDPVTTAVVAFLGGVLGVLFMIPMRRYLIVEKDAELPYPEGRACADVLTAGERGSEGGIWLISGGFGVGALYMWLADGMGAFVTTLQGAFSVGGTRGFSIGGDFTPALVGVGYIIGPRVAAYIFGGGLVAWMMLIPLLITGGYVPAETANAPLLEQANAVWSDYVRYVGAGAMIVGGLYAILSMWRTIADAAGLAARELRGTVETASRLRTQRDLPMGVVVVGAVLVIIAMVLVPQVRVGPLGGIIATLAAFLFVAVSSYLVGIIGSSSNPVSGMTVATILFAALAMNYVGVDNPVVVLITASVVCIAAAVAGDTSQDLKTGFLLGATPRSQQIAQLIGIALSALFAGWVLLFFNQAYGIGSNALPAPQAQIMALISESVLTGTANWGMILIGAVFGIVLLMMEVPVLPFAVGLYLPITLATPIFAGGLLRGVVDYWATRQENSEAVVEHTTYRGRIVAAGLIAGEALMGVFLGGLRVLGYGSPPLAVFDVSTGTQTLLGAIAVIALLAFIGGVTIRNAPAP